MENHLNILKNLAEMPRLDIALEDERIYGATGNMLLLVHSAVKNNIAVRRIQKLINVIHKDMTFLGLKHQTKRGECKIPSADIRGIIVYE